MLNSTKPLTPAGLASPSGPIQLEKMFFKYKVELINLATQMMGEYYKIDNVAPNFVFVTSQKLSKSFTLITNLGGSWNGSDEAPIGTYTLNLSCAFTDKFGAFVETYGSFAHGVFETRMDTGIAWLATRNLQLDLLGGFGRNQGLNDYFVSAGFSWRTRMNKRDVSNKS